MHRSGLNAAMAVWAALLMAWDAMAPVTAASGSGSRGAWHMRPITSLQARIEAYPPLWDEEHRQWVSGIGGPAANLSFEERYTAVLDSVTTSSIEGVLMYLQRDCIDIGENPRSAGCRRKNDVKVITFLEVEIANPNPALAEFMDDHSLYPEFCPFVEMRNGQCVVAGDEGTIKPDPPECQQYRGVNGQPHLGPCVGAEAFITDPIAPYFDTVWFSYPNGCVEKTWAAGKSTECRRSSLGGLCPPGIKPDGRSCSFAYKILGFLSIDELVGITELPKVPKKKGKQPSLVVSEGNAPMDGSEDDDEVAGEASNSSIIPRYQNYTDFCQDNNMEYHAFNKGHTIGFQNVRSLPFWSNPSSRQANRDRTAVMIAMYNEKCREADSNMIQLPTDIGNLTASNPPCYEHSRVCYDAYYGCARRTYAQVCSVCRELNVDCVPKRENYVFPTLETAPRTVSDGELQSRNFRSAGDKSRHRAKTSASGARSREGCDVIIIAVASALASLGFCLRRF